MTYSKQLARLSKTDARAVDYEFIGDDEEAPHWLHLASGWKSPEDQAPCHCINGRTVREVLSHWPPNPCDCEDCRKDFHRSA